MNRLVTKARSLIAFGLCALLPTTSQAQSRSSLAKLSLEELTQIEVTSVSKRPEKLFGAASAITVLTPDDIRLSGLTHLPNILRLVPGLHVGSIDANKWAVGSRGFANQFGKNLLVLIDGRSVYTPLFSGVYWDVQDLVLEDIERIEVIRGPGATTWGANAVNGVINITTKNAADTSGSLLSLSGGLNEASVASVRHGGSLGPKASYRVFAKYTRHHDSEDHAAGHSATDEWQLRHAGFRTDWTPTDRASLTLQGDIYEGRAGSQGTFFSLTPPFSSTRPFTTNLDGGNLLGRWRHRFANDSDSTLQLYYDRLSRADPQWTFAADTFDLDFNHHIPADPRHDFVWGLSYRHYRDDVAGSFDASVSPLRDTLQLFTGFLQDEITVLPDRLRLTLGAKLEHHEYTGLEFLPSLRLSWTPSETQTLWASLSRAIRTPSRSDRGLRLNYAVIPGARPTVLGQIGNPTTRSEQLLAYELGWRLKPSPSLSLDLATALNVYDQLMVTERLTPFLETTPPPAHLAILSQKVNRATGETYSAELSATWQATDHWRLSGGYTWFRAHLHSRAPGRSGETAELQNPERTFHLSSSLDLPAHWTLGATLYFVDDIVDLISAQPIPAYHRLDVRLGWRPRPDLELSLVGQNLLDPGHPEFGGIATLNTEVRRALVAKATWRF